MGGGRSWSSKSATIIYGPEVQLRLTMLKLSFSRLGIVALCVFALGACAGNETASAPPRGDAETTPQTSAAETAKPAVNAVEPDYPQPAIVIPPRPKPGAP